MSSTTAIGWTEATWNPVTGCSHVSEGCRFCYAEAIELRFKRSRKPWTAQNAAANVKLHPERVNQPLSWGTPRRVFVNSMSDLFHELVPDDFLNECFAVMALATRHTFQILTKRPARMLAFLTGPFYQNDWDIPHPPLPNVWLGVSAEDQRTWDDRVEILGRVPAAIHFVSAEPLLGAIDPGNAFDPAPDDSPYQPVDWLIIGGESGPHHRMMDPAWAESLAAQAGCVFVKQDSGPRPGKQGRLSDALWARKEYPAVRVAVS